MVVTARVLIGKRMPIKGVLKNGYAIIVPLTTPIKTKSGIFIKRRALCVNVYVHLKISAIAML